MSIGEGWASSNPKEAEKQLKTELSELLEAIETPGKPTLTIGNEAPASIDLTPRIEWLHIHQKHMSYVTDSPER